MVKAWLKMVQKLLQLERAYSDGRVSVARWRLLRVVCVSWHQWSRAARLARERALLIVRRWHARMLGAAVLRLRQQRLLDDWFIEAEFRRFFRLCHGDVSRITPIQTLATPVQLIPRTRW